MHLRPEKLPKHSNGPTDPLNVAYCAVGLRQVFTGTVTIVRWEDEPGAWRDEQGRLLDPARVKHLVPELAAELEERAHLEDKEKVASAVEGFLKGGITEVIEARGPYAIVNRQGGGLCDITRHGVKIHPSPLPEAMCRKILDSLAPLPVDLAPAEAPLDEALRAGAA